MTALVVVSFLWKFRVSQYTKEERRTMPDADYSSIGPLDAAAQKEAWSLIGLVILDMIVVAAAVWIIGTIANNM
jgi:hypothetical protein